MKYLNGWTIDPSKLSTYDEFKKPLSECIDRDVLEKIIEMKESDYDHICASTGEVTNVTWPILLDKRKDVVHNRNTLQCWQTCRLGRFQSNSFITLPKKIKHTLFSYAGMIDIDQEKGHPRIAYGLGLKNNKQYSNIKKYIDNPDEIFKQMGEHYGIDTDDADGKNKDRLKWFFNLTIYGGGYQLWLDGLKNPSKKDLSLGYKPLVLKTDEMLPIMQGFKDDCKDLADKIYVNNDEVRARLNEGHDEYATKTEHEKKSCVVSFVMQIIENDALHKAYLFLKKNKLMNDFKCVSLEYDGLCFIPKRQLQQNDIDELNAYVRKNTGFDIKYIIKPYKHCNIYHDVIDIVKQKKIDDAADLTDKSYESVKERFEQTYAKIGDKHTFVKKTDTECVFYNRNNFRINHEDIIYLEEKLDKDGNHIGTKKKQFIDEWFKDPEKKSYDDIGVYPNTDKCPENILNLWMPFAMEQVTDYTPTIEDRDFFLNHILQLCDYDQKVYEYLIKWVAQMIQYPETKTTCPVMISEEGAGKGTFMELIKLMIGQTKYLSTSSPSESVWGSKNGLMKDAFFVNLDELSGREAVGADGRIKTIISEPTMEIRQMYCERIVIPSFHRFFATTNNDECIGKKKGDRRKFIVYSSSDKCKERFRNDPVKYQELCKYHEKTHTLLKDVNFVKTMFDYFKYEVGDMRHFLSLEMPQTEFDLQAQELQVSPLEMWVEDYVRRNHELCNTDEPLRVTNSVLFSDFLEWKTDHRIEYECNSVKFGVRLSRLKINGISEPIKGKQCNHRLINFKAVAEHMKIENDETDDEEY